MADDAAESSGSAGTALPRRTAVPDRLDLRDRPYMPSVAVVPKAVLAPRVRIPVLDQGQTSACTGFALASVVYALQRAAARKGADLEVSPYMLYSMARRYDEFPGDPEADTGSSLRGAMKGWYKYGACARGLWTSEPMPAPAAKAKDDWWLDAVRRPLGAYYRVDTRSVADMQVALNEVGVLYASVACHEGWNAGMGATKREGYWPIPPAKAKPADGGHAFAIVGYDGSGFIIQNSWGEGWGSEGLALLAYEDWLDNAMDCWVAQLGVVTSLHEEIARSPSLRLRDGSVQLASDAALRAREIAPFVIDMENNGRLSNTGDFRTQDADIDALVTEHLRIARSAWGLAADDPVHVAIYAHGGLVSENAAAETAAKWIPALYEAKIFPIFLMWESDLISTLADRLEDTLRGEPRLTGAALEGVKTWWNERLERLLAHPGSMIWGEMKQNGDALTGAADSGGQKLYRACARSPWFADPAKVRLHLIGHSAGAIVHSHLIRRLGALGWNFESVNFMAPAARVDLFEGSVLPAIKQGSVRRYHQFHLSDAMEQKDPTCEPILGYSRSLLYLVSQSFENGTRTPILGMQKYFDSVIAPLGLPNVRAWPAPGERSGSTTHGGFSDDDATRASVIALIRGEGG